MGLILEQPPARSKETFVPAEKMKLRPNMSAGSAGCCRRAELLSPGPDMGLRACSEFRMHFGDHQLAAGSV